MTMTRDDSALESPNFTEQIKNLVRGRWGFFLVGAVVGALAGGIWRGYQPPFVLDDPFWRDFLTGPPAAGAFALAGAIVAYLAARTAASTAKRSALRDEWWDRAQWALNQLMSEDPSVRKVGFAALEVLVVQATRTEGNMIDAVTANRVLGLTPADVIDSGQAADGQ